MREGQAQVIDGGLISPTLATGHCPPLVPGLGDPARRPAQTRQGALSQEPAIASTHSPRTPPLVSPSAQQGQVW